MNDETPIAVVRTREQRRHSFSMIWLIPVITVVIAAWLAWDTLGRRGSVITISFDSATGLQPRQSRIRYRDVDLGVIQSVNLSTDRHKVIVTARMSREAEPMLIDKTLFWVVKPRFFAGSISGLETLVSGSYIQMQPSEEDGKPRTAFTGKEDPPVLRTSVPGRTFRLRTPRIGSLNLGSPILFRDQNVGEILGWDPGDMDKEVIIHAFVREPYYRYVHENTVFWNASGASVSLGGNGLKLQLESLQALVLGGVAFMTPVKGVDSPIAPAEHAFPLYTDHDAAETATFGRSLKFVSRFKGSVFGLSVGSPVVLHGLRIGIVTDVALHYEAPPVDAVVAVVRYEMEPDRIEQLNLPMSGDLDKVILTTIRQGLRARLESSSLITGSKQLAMELTTGLPPIVAEKRDDTYVVPAIDGDTGDIVSSASALVARLNAIPFEQIGDNLNQTLAGANGTVNDPRLRQAIASLSDTLVVTQALMGAVNKGVDPFLKRLPVISANLDEAVKHVDQFTASLNTGYGGNSQFARDTNRLLLQVSEAARAVRILADLLSRHPEALIRGRSEKEVR